MHNIFIQGILGSLILFTYIAGGILNNTSLYISLNYKSILHIGPIFKIFLIIESKNTPTLANKKCNSYMCVRAYMCLIP